MTTRRVALVQSLKFAGLFAGAALVAGCGDSGPTTTTNKISPEQAASQEKANAASAAHAAEEAKKKK